MRIEFDISDETTSSFSEGAKSELIRQCCRIAEDIVDESCRIEAARRIDDDTESEITPSNVKEAANQPKMIITRKKSILQKVVQIIAFLTSMIAGSLLDTDKFNNISHVIWFIVMLFLAISTTVYLIFNQDNNE